MTTEVAAVADSRETCRAIIAEHSKSFALASKLLPAAVRDDAVALYAWCRRADDAVDHSSDPRASLDRLSRELDHLLLGAGNGDPVLEAFAKVRKARKIPAEYLRELLAGMEMDVDGRRYASTQELLLYCHRVAGVVGLMMCHVLGVSSSDALSHAAHLGIGMQLTNICRDVAEDWDRGRLYLPEDLLDADAVRMLHEAEGGPLPRAAERGIAGAVRSLLALADRYYHSGDRGLKYLDGRCALAVRAARCIYSSIGKRIARTNCSVLAGRAVVPKSTKLLLAGRSLGTSFLELPLRSIYRSQFAPPIEILRAADAIRLE